ncbi:hypothetical protein NWO25_18775 [Enterococcus lactis]|nr:hypothetical protein [Enterococcus lactis]
MYTDGRFFAITGNFFGNNNEVNEIPKTQMDFLYKRYLENDNVINHDFSKTSWNDGNDLSVNEIVQTALSSSTGHRFKLFMDGGWEKVYSSQSEADLAFANDLAFWTAGDFQKMDEIFRMSAMMREKYDQKRGKTTYGIGILNKAISENTNHYTGKKKLMITFCRFLELLPKTEKVPKDFTLMMILVTPKDILIYLER